MMHLEPFISLQFGRVLKQQPCNSYILSYGKYSSHLWSLAYSYSNIIKLRKYIYKNDIILSMMYYLYIYMVNWIIFLDTHLI